MRRIDAEGRVIIHGRRYIYSTGHPYLPRMSGVISWDTDSLCHLFQPDDKDLLPIVVNFNLYVQPSGRRVLETTDFWREPKR